MRKEVKRSLLFWPAFVSATIILMSLLTDDEQRILGLIDRVDCRSRSGARSPVTDQMNPQLADSRTLAVSTGITIADRYRTAD